jgi:hypothetical protein
MWGCTRYNDYPLDNVNKSGKNKGVNKTQEGKERPKLLDQTNKLQAVINEIQQGIASDRHDFLLSSAQKAITLLCELQNQFSQEKKPILGQHTDLLERRRQSDISKNSEQTLTLPDPETGDYERWANRADKNEKPLDFLARVWGEYIDAGVMYQSNLRGQQKTQTNPNPKEPLDKLLFQAVSKQCRDENNLLNNYLPNKSKQVDKELEYLMKSGEFKEKINSASRLLMASRNRAL